MAKNPGGQQNRRSGAGARRILTCAEAVAALDKLQDVERASPAAIDKKAVFTLERMRKLLDALGTPCSHYPVVHVAGTKGKGSVCDMLGAALCGCGLTVGVYTSPHLLDVRERIRINGEWVTPEAFGAVVARVLDAAEDAGVAPTHFEAVTAAALLHFADEAVDVAVVETGMGGTNDATNVVTPALSVITPIHSEHAEVLGPALTDIAAHKAGIIKPGVAALSAPQTPEVAEVLRARAAGVGAPLRVVGVDCDYSYRFQSDPDLGPHFRVTMSDRRHTFEGVPAPLKGDHQAVNCALVLAAVGVLREQGMDLPEVGVVEGLARTQANGRAELVFADPRIVVDGAHTPESVGNLVRALGAHMKFDSAVVVFGCAADKDVAGLLANLAQGADKVIFTKATGHARGAEPRELLRAYAEHASGKMAQAAPTVKDAINMAARAVQRGDLVVVTGSFAVAGEAKRLLLAKQGLVREEGGVIREVKPLTATGAWRR
ncbi:MAG TPA: folylpolyglutamate synthase/dihydrofolate synthase family protein [Tepidisphaeraceae bacterium]|nr:folylpolyglutamate synthase/dihydrofolate synthase family protein [Tepidisphaeraceae bacterium]